MMPALSDDLVGDTAPPTPGVSPGRTEIRRIALVVLAPLLASLALLIVASDRMDAPFSPAFPDFNTAVWATGAQAVRADGWWDSRLGAASGPTGSEIPYAHHPPLVRVEVAIAEMALGEHRWVDRLPALVSSLAAIWLCWGWLGACGFSPGPRSLGVIAAGGTGLMLSYGVMLNMEVIWMPLAFALLWAWQRAERHGGGFWSCLLLGLVGCTAAHQGMLLAAGLALLGIVSARRRHRQLEPHEQAMIASTIAGVAVFLVWAVWASGGISDLIRIALERGGTQFTWVEFVRAQFSSAVSLFGVIGIVCLLAGVALVRRRPALVGQMVVVCGVTLVYALVFRQGATIHDYWNAAALPAIALGGALLGERLAPTSHTLLPAACVGAAALMLVSAISITRIQQNGDAAGFLAREAGERQVPVLYSTEIVSEWVTYESGTTVELVYPCRAVRRLAARDPEALILTSTESVETLGTGVWDALSMDPSSTVIDNYALTHASVIAAVC